MAESSGEKQFDATPHRRQQARQKGQVPFSQDLGSALLLVVSALLLKWFAADMVSRVQELMVDRLGVLQPIDPDPLLASGQLQADLGNLSLVLLPIMGAMMLAGIVASVGQLGFLWVPERLAPDFTRLNPISGLGRIFSLQGTAKLGFGLLKVVIVAAVAAWLIYAERHVILYASEMELEQIATAFGELTVDLLLWIGGALLVLALADLAFQRWKHEQDLKMTHQEMKEEMKNMQGDPHVAQRRRQIQRQLAMNQMGMAVPKADVVVTNPTELAIAIQYDPLTMRAPVVVAKGAGVLAQRIRRLALENNVPIVERKPLARLLYKEVDVNHPIPDGSYAAVAEVLAYVYRLKGKRMPGRAA
jgi:flagellar biosynthetic protein FlhB